MKPHHRGENPMLKHSKKQRRSGRTLTFSHEEGEVVAKIAGNFLILKTSPKNRLSTSSTAKPFKMLSFRRFCKRLALCVRHSTVNEMDVGRWSIQFENIAIIH